MSRRSPLLLLLLLSTAGCDTASRSPSAPLARIAAPSNEAQALTPASPWRYPLILGATWIYEGSERTRERLDGQPDFGPATSRRFVRVARAARWTDFPGIEYLVIESALTFKGGSGPLRTREYLREDDAALYSYPDLGGTSALASGGPAEPAPRQMETIVLVYPVRVGSVWRSNGTEFTVEAIEPIPTRTGIEPAARVRARSEAQLGGRQPELTWFGRSGVLRTWDRREEPFTTPLGQHGVRERITEQHLFAATGF